MEHNTIGYLSRAELKKDFPKEQSLSLSLSFYYLFIYFLLPLQHAEIPLPGIEPEPQQRPQLQQ